MDGSTADGCEAGHDDMRAVAVRSWAMNEDEVPRMGRETQSFAVDPEYAL
jgi:hypothetical protein